MMIEKEADAMRLGDTLGAMRSRAYPGWKSQRVFGVPLAVTRKIEKALTHQYFAKRDPRDAYAGMTLAQARQPIGAHRVLSYQGASHRRRHSY